MRVLIGLVAALFCATASAGKVAYNAESIMFMQPDVVLRERVDSAEDLANYIKAVQGAAASALAVEKTAHPASGYIVLAVRPGGKSKVWLDFSPNLPSSLDARLRATLGAVAPFDARHGVVVFAINSTLWGAPPTQRSPAPPEWKKAMEGASGPSEVGDFMDRIWPGNSARAPMRQHTPDTR